MHDNQHRDHIHGCSQQHHDPVQGLQVERHELRGPCPLHLRDEMLGILNIIDPRQSEIYNGYIYNEFLKRPVRQKISKDMF